MEEEAGAGGPSGLTSGVWVPLGSCKRAPEKYHASAEEMQKARNKVAMLAAEAGDEAEDVPMEGGEEEGEENKVDEAAEEEEDDEESDESEGANLEIPLQGADVQNIESDDESELNDLQVMPDDMVFLCAHQRTNGSSTLEVYVYDDEHENVYLHHDIMLPAIPLCVAWASSGRKKDGTAVEGGSFAAVTTFLPFIEVWDLDIIDAPDPAITLGGCKRPSDNYRAKNLTASSLKKNSHKDSVLCARWNPGVKKVLASGSADNTVKLWDLHTGENLLTATHHQAPVQCMEWFSQEPHSLLTGSFDQTAVVLDCRTQKKVLSMKLGATPESLAISPFDTTKVFVTTESGHLKQFDVRNAGKAMWSVKAHTSEAAGLAVNPGVNGLVATGGVDSEVKLWDVRADPVALASRNLQQGRVFSLHFSPDRPAYLLASGDAGKPLVYCVTQDVSSAFGVPSQGAHQAATSSSSP